MATKRDIELMFEISAFRGMPRAWQHWLGPHTANHAEHSFRTALYALMIAQREGVGDHGRILKMALMHDLPESRCSDVDYLQRHYVTRNEEKAAHDVFEDTSLSKEAADILQEYWDRKTIESKIVKDADMLDVDIELRENIVAGQVALKRKVDTDRKFGVYPRLYTETAKLLWKEIHKANPHGWHQNSPYNRFNGGDWKKVKSKKK